MTKNLNLAQKLLVIFSITGGSILLISYAAFSKDYEAWIYMNFVSWFLLISTSILLRESLLSLYFFYFGVVFILPPIILSPDNFLTNGLILKAIYLPHDKWSIILSIISTFLVVAILSLFFTVNEEKIRERNLYSGEIKFKFLFYSLFFLSFFSVVSFNIKEALAVFNEGYGALKSGELSVQKSLFIFLLELCFISMSIILIYLRRFIWLPFFIIYTLTLIFVGERLPPILFLFFLVFYYLRIPYSSISIVIVCILFFFLGAPVLMFIAAFREGADLSTQDFLHYYEDFWIVVGHSFDTLKAVVMEIDNEMDVEISPFARLYKIVDVIFLRLFETDLSITTNSFGEEFTKALDPLMLEMNRTFSSSGIAESFYFFGYFGILIYNAIIILVMNIIKINSVIRSPQNLMIVVVFAASFFQTVRGQLYGGIIDALMEILFLSPFILIFSSVFLLKLSKKS